MNYVIEVAELFVLRRQTAEILTPTDYEIIAEWEKEEIPLEIVLNSINHVFDRLAQSNEPFKIETIADVQTEVEKNFASWLQKLNDRS